MIPGAQLFFTQEQRCFDVFPDDVKKEIVKVRPGLSGIGSIVFRDEEELLDNANDEVRFYDDVIAPYKGALEVWLVRHQSLKNYFLVILVTVWVVLCSDSRIVWRVFDGLPEAPDELAMLRVG